MENFFLGGGGYHGNRPQFTLLKKQKHQRKICFYSKDSNKLFLYVLMKKYIMSDFVLEFDPENI